MAARIKFAGCEDTDFIFNGVYALSTTAGYFDPAYTRGAIQIRSTGIATGLFENEDGSSAAMSDFWFGTRFRWVYVTTWPTGTFVRFTNGATEVARLYSHTDGVLELQLHNGSGWVTVATDVFKSRWVGALGKMDICLKLHETEGLFVLYDNGVPVVEYAGDTIRGGVTTVDRVHLSGREHANEFSYYSEVVVSDTDTRSMRVRTMVGTGAGAHSDGTGAYGDVDEWAVSSVDAIALDTAGQRHSMALTDLPAGLVGMSVAAVVAVGSMSRGDTGPQTGHLGVRVGGTTNTAAVPALAMAFETRRRIMHANPVTGAAFTESEANGMELVLGAEA